ncbi:phospholipase A2-like protein Y52B11A.8 [Ditylenchus destructor]|uniref:Phospholipase A2-like protein Y52B11A.8 n=1 Tax=Ditylenchus destructor TaxID=166010 RepID=A0AAD4QTN5_9BILA|nr:phospholipase A2-like protein Y52B11A.8 [Ditylenchus destructor]
MVAAFFLPVIVILIISRYAIADDWACGSGQFLEDVAEIDVNNDCPENKAAMNACCVTHDSCYGGQQARSTCDDNFCKCLTNATASSSVCSTKESPEWCNLVKVFGGMAYETTSTTSPTTPTTPTTPTSPTASTTPTTPTTPTTRTTPNTSTTSTTLTTPTDSFLSYIISWFHG